MDLVFIPLMIDLRVIVKLKLLFFKKTIYNKRIWHYQTKAIKKNIFILNDAEEDTSPPNFARFSRGVSVFVHIMNLKLVM